MVTGMIEGIIITGIIVMMLNIDRGRIIRVITMEGQMETVGTEGLRIMEGLLCLLLLRDRKEERETLTQMTEVTEALRSIAARRIIHRDRSVSSKRRRNVSIREEIAE